MKLLIARKKNSVLEGHLQWHQESSKMLNTFRSELFLPHGNEHTAHTYEELPTKREQNFPPHSKAAI